MAALERCSLTGEYEDWPLLKAAILGRLDEVVAAFRAFETRRLSLVDGGATLSDAAIRTARAGLGSWEERVAEFRTTLEGFERRYGLLASRRLDSAALGTPCALPCSAPFTVQRLCEILLRPQQQYRFLDKLLNAVEKVCGVVFR